LLIPVSNGAGFGALPCICRKNASYRPSTETIDDVDLRRRGSVDAMRSARPIMALIPSDVMISLNARNCGIVATGNE